MYVVWVSSKMDTEVDGLQQRQQQQEPHDACNDFDDNVHAVLRTKTNRMSGGVFKPKILTTDTVHDFLDELAILMDHLLFDVKGLENYVSRTSTGRALLNNMVNNEDIQSKFDSFMWKKHVFCAKLKSCEKSIVQCHQQYQKHLLEFLTQVTQTASP